MKRILITGAGSYIGTSFASYMAEHYGEEYTVDTRDMVDGTWREMSMAGYDTVFHVAGLAHADVGRVSEEERDRYYKINTALTIEVAEAAKRDGVGQFIFMSSMIVFGESAEIGRQRVIDETTEPAPANFYGDSKLQAERGILPLSSDTFRVVILRPPMIYGRGSRGNYPILQKFARRCPFFPYVKNERSMLYVDNLSEFVYLMIKHREAGIFHPQNAEYANTAELVRMIARANGKRVLLVRGLGWALRLLSHFTGLVNKAFGTMKYDMALSEYRENYRVCTLQESIERTESK